MKNLNKFAKVILSLVDRGEISVRESDFKYSDNEKQWMEIGARKEREACALVCENMEEFLKSDEEHDALFNAATKIRERNKHEA